MHVREDGKAYAADVTIEELTGFMLHHAGELSCCCGTASWNIPEHEGKPVVTTLPTPMAHADGMNTFSVSCSNCGRMEMFSAQTVVSKLVGWNNGSQVLREMPGNRNDVTERLLREVGRLSAEVALLRGETGIQLGASDRKTFSGFPEGFVAKQD